MHKKFRGLTRFLEDKEFISDFLWMGQKIYYWVSLPPKITGKVIISLKIGSNKQ